jgi:hypothetical protein
VWLSNPLASVAESAGSTKDSEPAASISAGFTAAWATVSGTPTLRQCSWRGWRTRAWSNRLFGAETLPSWTPSLCGDGPTQLLPDSLASRGAPPASSKARPTHAGSGRLSFGSSWTWNPQSCSWKTSQGSFLEEESNTSSVILPRSGSMRNGSLFRRRRLALRTSESECSSWPTVRAHEVGDYQNQVSGPAIQTLTGVATNWPSPRSEDSESCGNHPNATDSLTGATALWATPNAMAGGSTSRSGDRIGEALLGGQVQNWPTPNATDDRRGNTGYTEKQRNRKEGMPKILNHEVASWPTPNARHHKGTDLASRNGGVSLSHATQTGVFTHSSPQVPVTSTDGVELSPTALSTSERRRLNPAFVCWLMGSPWWWTRAEPISFAAEETALWRCKLRSRLSSLCGELAPPTNERAADLRTDL